ncbi:hypothetical protein ACFX2K_008341 [Malus domestica]
MTCRPWSYDLCSSAMEEPPSATATEPPSSTRRGLRLTLRLRALRTMRNEVDLPIGDFEETRSTCAGPSAAETRRYLTLIVFCTMLLLFDDENPLIELTDDDEEDATNLHIDKHSLLDSGILCCLIHILNAHLDPDEANQKQKATDRDEPFPTEKDYDGDAGQVHRLEILVLLLVNDNRSTAKYICKHHLIKALLMAVKDFNPDCGDSTYTMGIMDLPLPVEAGGVWLREDIRNAEQRKALSYMFLKEDVIVGHEILLINNLSLDSCCLIHILNALLDPDEANQKKKATDRDELFKSEEDYDGDAGQVRRLEVALT